jgi:hypothetical protein
VLIDDVVPLVEYSVEDMDRVPGRRELIMNCSADRRIPEKGWLLENAALPSRRMIIASLKTSLQPELPRTAHA